MSSQRRWDWHSLLTPGTLSISFKLVLPKQQRTKERLLSSPSRCSVTHLLCVVASSTFFSLPMPVHKAGSSRVPPGPRPRLFSSGLKLQSPLASHWMSACKNKQTRGLISVCGSQLVLIPASLHCIKSLAVDRVPVAGTCLKPNGLRKMTSGVWENSCSLGKGEGRKSQSYLSIMFSPPLQPFTSGFCTSCSACCLSSGRSCR